MKLPAAKIVAALPRLAGELGPDPDRAADAIMTTDTTRKLASRTISLGGVLLTFILATIRKYFVRRSA